MIRSVGSCEKDRLCLSSYSFRHDSLLEDLLWGSSVVDVGVAVCAFFLFTTC